MAEITHWLSVIKITPQAADDPTIAPDDRVRGKALADRLQMRVLTRMWQMLLKALEEVGLSPNAMMAAEMAVIRMTHVADLPTPGDLVKKLQDTPPAGPSPAPRAPGPGSAPGPQAHAAGPTSITPVAGGGGGAQAALAQVPAVDLSQYPTFDSVVALIEGARDMVLQVAVKTNMRLVSYAPGRIEFEPANNAPEDLSQRLTKTLKSLTGARWIISVANEGGAPTLAEQEQAARQDMETEVSGHPLMQAVLSAFPEAKITDIRTHDAIEAQAEVEALEALPEDDDWDPFEDD